MTKYIVQATIVCEVRFTMKAGTSLRLAQQKAKVICENLKRMTEDPMTGSRPVDLKFIASSCNWNYISSNPYEEL